MIEGEAPYELIRHIWLLSLANYLIGNLKKECKDNYVTHLLQVSDMDGLHVSLESHLVVHERLGLTSKDSFWALAFSKG
jgi:hypothetical protein